MMWITANIGTVAVLVLLVVIVGFAVASIVNDRKKGKSCGCGCEHCAMSKSCHKT